MLLIFSSFKFYCRYFLYLCRSWLQLLVSSCHSSKCSLGQLRSSFQKRNAIASTTLSLERSECGTHQMVCSSHFSWHQNFFAVSRSFSQSLRRPFWGIRCQHYSARHSGPELVTSIVPSRIPFFRQNAITFRAIGIGHFMFVRSFVRHKISSSNISKTG